METQAQEYFNLHINGVGYLSRVRWVEPGGRRGGRRAERFLSCAINALHGDVEAVNYTYFDLKVSGQEAIEVIQTLQTATEQNRKVLVSFKAADIYPHLYDRRVRVDGEPTDEFETAALIKGRLILVNSAKVDGELVFKREPVVHADDASTASDAAPQPTADAASVESTPVPSSGLEEQVRVMRMGGENRWSSPRGSANQHVRQRDSSAA